VRAARAAGDVVHVVVVTNGDAGGTTTGLRRQAESVAAAQVLGLTEQDVVFLGYPDGSMLTIYQSGSTTQVYTSLAGRTATYGSRGLGGVDFHTYRTGSAGAYNRASVLEDFRALLTTFLPDEIYTVSQYDAHEDHQATARFVVEAILGLRREGNAQPRTGPSPPGRPSIRTASTPTCRSRSPPRSPRPSSTGSGSSGSRCRPRCSPPTRP